MSGVPVFPVAVMSVAAVLTVASSMQAVDLTTEPEASGKDVVLSVVSRIHNSQVFPFDNQLLRRIAWVESKDGTDPNTYREGYHGGIWQVDEIGFADTQDTSSHPGLLAKYEQIRGKFGIDWPTVMWQDLRKPLYSGLAARLFLSNIAEAIPLASDIEGQARYWKEHYNTPAGDGTVEKFTKDVLELSELTQRECPVNMDLIFVLDSSGSVGLTDYNAMKTFTSQFVSGLTIGENDNRVGAIIFGTRAQVAFNLNTHYDKQSLFGAIDAIPYLDAGNTNTADGICLLLTQGFTQAGGARNSNSVFRVAIVITDGKSNANGNTCGYNNVFDAASSLHMVQPQILVYAIGVGNFNEEELLAIATSDDTVSEITSFGSSQLLRALEERQFQICFEATKPAEFKTPQQGMLDKGEQTRFEYSIPENGTEIEICARNGSVLLYASTEVPNPNSAFHDAKIQTSMCGTVIIRPKDRSSNLSSQKVNKRDVQTGNDDVGEVDEGGTEGVDIRLTLYVSVQGLDESNDFILTLIDAPAPIEPTTMEPETSDMFMESGSGSGSGSGNGSCAVRSPGGLFVLLLGAVAVAMTKM